MSNSAKPPEVREKGRGLGRVGLGGAAPEDGAGAGAQLGSLYPPWAQSSRGRVRRGPRAESPTVHGGEDMVAV